MHLKQFKASKINQLKMKKCKYSSKSYPKKIVLRFKND